MVIAGSQATTIVGTALRAVKPIQRASLVDGKTTALFKYKLYDVKLENPHIDSQKPVCSPSALRAPYSGYINPPRVRYIGVWEDGWDFCESGEGYAKIRLSSVGELIIEEVPDDKNAKSGKEK